MSQQNNNSLNTRNNDNDTTIITRTGNTSSHLRIRPTRSTNKSYSNLQKSKHDSTIMWSDTDATTNKKYPYDSTTTCHSNTPANLLLNDTTSIPISSQVSSSSNPPSLSIIHNHNHSPTNLRNTILIAIIYILSGATQPLLMTLVKSAGLGDPKCQVYMLFYYFGPAFVTFTFFLPNHHLHDWTSQNKKRAIIQASCIALLDIMAQATNYTGSTYSGPTIFSIVYSSVTVWAAIYSRVLLQRKLHILQWIGICIVFFGLCYTTFSTSVTLGSDVLFGSMMVLVGSSLHAMTYVLSEAIMVRKNGCCSRTNDRSNNNTETKEEERIKFDLSASSSTTTTTSTISPKTKTLTNTMDTKNALPVQVNCAIQGLVACITYLSWQYIYTSKHYVEAIKIPMEKAGTSITYALLLLLSLSLSNFIHALSFFYTLKNFPGGSTSAGVMKGLQAVVIFIFSSVMYCGSSLGGEEMCFSMVKLISLIIVVSGVIIFAYGTDRAKSDSRLHKTNSNAESSCFDSSIICKYWYLSKRNKRRHGYTQINNNNIPSESLRENVIIV